MWNAATGCQSESAAAMVGTVTRLSPGLCRHLSLPSHRARVLPPQLVLTVGTLVLAVYAAYQVFGVQLPFLPPQPGSGETGAGYGYGSYRQEGAAARAVLVCGLPVRRQGVMWVKRLLFACRAWKEGLPRIRASIPLWFTRSHAPHRPVCVRWPASGSAVRWRRRCGRRRRLRPLRWTLPAAAAPAGAGRCRAVLRAGAGAVLPWRVRRCCALPAAPGRWPWPPPRAAATTGAHH